MPYHLPCKLNYLGVMPTVAPNSCETSENAKEHVTVFFEPHNRGETILNYLDRLRQCEGWVTLAMAEQIAKILVHEQITILISLALGVDVAHRRTRRIQPQK